MFTRQQRLFHITSQTLRQIFQRTDHHVELNLTTANGGSRAKAAGTEGESAY